MLSGHSSVGYILRATCLRNSTAYPEHSVEAGKTSRFPEAKKELDPAYKPTTRQDLCVLLRAELGAGVGDTDIKLRSTLHDRLALARRHIMSDLGGVRPVHHEEQNTEGQCEIGRSAPLKPTSLKMRSNFGTVDGTNEATFTVDRKTET